MEWERRFEAEVSRVTNQALRLQGRQRIGLYYRLGGLAVAPMEAPPEGYELRGALEGVRTREQMRARIWGWARRLPILPQDED